MCSPAQPTSPRTPGHGIPICNRPPTIRNGRKHCWKKQDSTLEDGVWTGPTPTPEKDIDVLTDKNGPVKPLMIELWAPAGETQNELILQVVAQAWEQIGVKTEQKFEDISTIFGPEGYQFTDAMTAGLYSWYNTSDPDNTWYWSSQYIPETPTGAGGNVQAYFFPFNFQAEIDAIIDPAVSELDQDKRAEAYFASQKLLNEQVPTIFIYWDKLFSAVANNVGRLPANHVQFTLLERERVVSGGIADRS